MQGLALRLFLLQYLHCELLCCICFFSRVGSVGEFTAGSVSPEVVTMCGLQYWWVQKAFYS
jgi:hypothetical protein